MPQKDERPAEQPTGRSWCAQVAPNYQIESGVMVPQQSLMCNKQAHDFFWPTELQLAKIEASRLVFVAAAYTAPSITAAPEALGNASGMAGGAVTASEYRRMYGGCGVNARPRLRALAISTSNGLEILVDLDKSPSAQAMSGLLVSLLSQDGRVVVTVDSEILLGFVMHQAPALQITSKVIDLAVVARTLRPDLPYAIAALAAKGDELAKGLVGKNPTTLRSLCCALDVQAASERFPSGREWHLSELSSSGDGVWFSGEGHAQALSSRVLAVRAIWWQLAGVGSPSNNLANLAQSEGAREFFEVFAGAPLELAKIHARGMPISMDAVEELESTAFGAVPSLVGDLIAAIPELEELRPHLKSTDSHASAEVRRVIGGYAAACGHSLPCDEEGLPKIGADAATLHGAHQLPGMVAWFALEDCKRQLNSAVELRRRSKLGADDVRRIHPTLRVGAVSGRTTCTLPNAQGFDERTKQAIEAPAGHVLIEADFGAIEIRIAAAQAVRSMQLVGQILRGEVRAMPWVKKGLEVAVHTIGDLPKPDGSGADWDEVAYWCQRAMRSGMPLVELLKSGLCPHDYTGLGLAQRAGWIDLAGQSRMDHLRRTPRQELRESIGTKRKAAKVVNLGLLYQMRAKGLWTKGILDGLDWTLEEATAAREDWFEQFPEVAFSSLLCLENDMEGQGRQLLLPQRYGRGNKLQSCVRLYRSQTLGGRPVVTQDDRVINLRAQGTGATLLLQAIAELPQATKDCVIMAVHDSILLCVPERLRDFHAAELSASMLRTASKTLGEYGIPCVVDVETGPNWGSLRPWRIA